MLVLLTTLRKSTIHGKTREFLILADSRYLFDKVLYPYHCISLLRQMSEISLNLEFLRLWFCRVTFSQVNLIVLRVWASVR